MLRSPAVLFSGSALFALCACSSLGTKDECRADIDCKGDRLCTSRGVCADPVRCDDGSRVAEESLCKSDTPERDACAGLCDAGRDAETSMSNDAQTACESGSCDAGETAFCASSVSCYESAFASACPGNEWGMGAKRFSCESTGGAPFLHYETGTWNKQPPDVLEGPTLSLASATRLRFEITHRFNPDKAAGLRGMIVISAEGADPRAGFVLKRWDAPLSQTVSVSEEGSVQISDLPIELQANVRVSLIAGGAENLTLITPMAWDIARLALRAE